MPRLRQKCGESECPPCAPSSVPFRCDSFQGNGTLRGWSKAQNENTGDWNERKFTRIDYSGFTQWCYADEICGPYFGERATRRSTFSGYSLYNTASLTIDGSNGLQEHSLYDTFNHGSIGWPGCGGGSGDDFSQSFAGTTTGLPVYLRDVHVHCGDDNTDTWTPPAWSSIHPDGARVLVPVYDFVPTSDVAAQWTPPGCIDVWTTQEPCSDPTPNHVIQVSGTPAIALSIPDTVAAAQDRSNGFTNVTANAGTDVCTRTGHNWFTGYKIRYVSGTGFGGLVPGNTYWVIGIDANTFKLAASAADAVAGTAIDVTSNGSSGRFMRLGAECRTTAGSSIDDTEPLEVAGIAFTAPRSVKAVRPYTGLTPGTEYVVTVSLKRYDPGTNDDQNDDEDVDVYFTPSAADGELRYDVPIEDDADVEAVAMTLAVPA